MDNYLEISILDVELDPQEIDKLSKINNVILTNKYSTSAKANLNPIKYDDPDFSDEDINLAID